MTLCNFPFGSNPILLQFNACIGFRWTSFWSDGTFTISCKGWLFSDLPCEYLALLIYLLACILFDIIVRSIVALLASLLLMLRHIKHTFWNTNQARMGLIWFSLLWPMLEFYSIFPGCSFLTLWFWLFFVYAHNDSTGIMDYIPWLNITEMNMFPYKKYHLLDLICKAVFIFSNSKCTIHLCWYQNVCFFISEEVSLYYNFVFDYYKPSHISKYSLLPYPIDMSCQFFSDK